MGRTGISQEQVNAVADRIADTDGMAAVSLRRGRRELGTGSMQTIHRMLASWRALADLRKPAPTADQTTLPVRFIDPGETPDLSRVSLIGTLTDHNGNINCKQGQPPDGVAIISNSPGFAEIADTMGFPVAKAVSYEYKGIINGQKKFETKVLGLAIEASQGEHLNYIADEYHRCGRTLSRDSYFAGIQRQKVEEISRERKSARAEICIKLDRDLYDLLMARRDPVRFLAGKIEETIRG